MYTIRKKTSATKRPSEPKIVDLYDKLVADIHVYSKKIVLVASILVITAMVIGAYAYVQADRDKRASALLSDALEYYSPSTGIPSDYSRALELLRGVAESYSGTTNGAIARYYAASCLVNLGRREEALAEYQKLVKKRGNKLIRGLAYQRIGYLLAGKGDVAEAIRAFEQADRLIGPGIAAVELARLYEKTGNVEKAQKTYRLITEKLPGTQWAIEAMAKLPPPDTSKQASSDQADPSKAR